jgi:hypothetical protein
VLLHDGRAVLAVDEHLRYGPLKAGYHGGGAPAEAVVPVAVLVPGTVPDEADLQLAPPQEPRWWIDPVAPVAAVPPSLAQQDSTGRTPRPGAEFRRRQKDMAPTLFDAPDAEPAPASPGTAVRSRPGATTPGLPGTATPASPAAAAVLKSAAYAAQKKIAGRVSVTDDQIRGLLGALLAAPGGRLVPAAAATALAVSPVTLRGAVLHAQRLLNADGYPVLRVDADGATVILDEGLLREQFGIRG